MPPVVAKAANVTGMGGVVLVVGEEVGFRFTYGLGRWGRRLRGRPGFLDEG